MPTKGKWRLRTTAIAIGAIGLPMTWLGAELALVGGTPYYVCAGILMSLSAVELWRRAAPRVLSVFRGTAADPHLGGL